MDMCEYVHCACTSYSIGKSQNCFLLKKRVKKRTKKDQCSETFLLHEQNNVEKEKEESVVSYPRLSILGLILYTAYIGRSWSRLFHILHILHSTFL